MKWPLAMLAALAIVVRGLAAPSGASAEWIADGSLDVVHESNVNLAQFGRDKKHDSALAPAVSAGWMFQLGDRSAVTITGDAGGMVWERYSGLNHIALGATTAFRTKFGLGPAAPWLRLAASGAREEYEDKYEDNPRDAWRYRLAVGAGKSFGERFGLSAEYAFERHVADRTVRTSRTLPGDVFTRQSQAIGLRGDVLVTQSITVFAGYTFRDGDVVSTTPRNATIFNASSALTGDRVFGENAVAYRVSAEVHAVNLGISVAVGRYTSINLGWEHQAAEAWRDVNYGNDIVRGGVAVRY